MKHTHTVAGIFLSLALVFSATSFYQIVNLLRGSALLSADQSVAIVAAVSPSMKFPLAAETVTRTNVSVENTSLALPSTILGLGDNVLFRFSATGPRTNAASVASDSMYLTQSNVHENNLKLIVYSDPKFTHSIATSTAADLDYSVSQARMINFNFISPVVVPVNRTYYFQVVENLSSVTPGASVSAHNSGLRTFTLTAPIPVSVQQIPNISVVWQNGIQNVLSPIATNLRASIIGTNLKGVSAVHIGGVTVPPLTLNTTATATGTSYFFFSVPPQLTAGVYNLTVTTPGGVSNAIPVTVKILANTNPTISTVTPSSVSFTSPVTWITITGTNFDSLTMVDIDGAGPVASPYSIASSSMTFIVPPSLSVGRHTIQVAQQGSTIPPTTSAYLTVVAATTTSTTAPSGFLSLSTDQNTPLSNEIVAASGPGYNQTPIGSPVTLSVFDLNAQGDNIKINSLSLSIVPLDSPGNSGSAVIQNVYLYGPDGKVIASTVPIASVATFRNLNYLINKNTTQVFSLKVDVASANAYQKWFTVAYPTVTAQNSLGVALPASSISGDIRSNNFSFRNAGPQITLVSLPTVTKSSNSTNNGSSTSVLSATFDIKATAIGDLVNFGGTGSTSPAFGTSTTNVIIYKDGAPDLTNSTNSQYHIAVSYSQPSTGVTLSPNGLTYLISEDNIAEFIVTYSISLSGLPSTHTYAIQLAGVNWQTPTAVGVQTTNFMNGQSAWKTAPISLP